MTNKPKVLFTANFCPLYRLPFFEGLSERYPIFFVFTEKPYEETVYGKLNHEEHPSKKAFLRMIYSKYDVLVMSFPFEMNFAMGCITFFSAKILRKKIVLWSEEWTDPLTKRQKLLRPFLKYLATHCDAIAVCGSAAKEHLLSYGASPEKIFISPNASYVEIPNGNDKVGRSSEFTILFLGRLVEIKGIEYLLRAFSKLEKETKNVKLVLVGEGPLKPQLESLVTELGIKNIHFDVASGSARYFFYKNCDLVVLPSVWLPYHCEAWGMVLNEAMQFGKPIITTDAVGAAPDLVQNGVNGFIVKNRDSQALYQAMKQLAENPELVKHMGEKSKRIVSEQFTYEKMVEGFDAAISFAALKKPKSKD
jgi:glycosyltransferase involved in cell wall biosynthesis